MGKRSRQRAKGGGDGPKAPTSTYEAGGMAIELRGVLTPATRRAYAELGGTAASSQEDRWQRQVEFLFERLAVSWTIAGEPLEGQKLLLGRFRMASADERAWVRDRLREHLAEWFPDVEAP